MHAGSGSGLNTLPFLWPDVPDTRIDAVIDYGSIDRSMRKPVAYGIATMKQFRKRVPAL